MARLTIAQQSAIWDVVDSLPPESWEETRQAALAELERLRSLRLSGLWTDDCESKSYRMLEIATVIEARQKGKGSIYRARRRIELAREFLRG